MSAHSSHPAEHRQIPLPVLGKLRQGLGTVQSLQTGGVGVNLLTVGHVVGRARVVVVLSTPTFEVAHAVLGKTPPGSLRVRNPGVVASVVRAVSVVRGLLLNQLGNNLVAVLSVEEAS